MNERQQDHTPGGQQNQQGNQNVDRQQNQQNREQQDSKRDPAPDELNNTDEANADQQR
jgi:hypothetical protein